MDPAATDILPLLEQLDDEIDDLEDSLAPVLETGISDTASKLPLLDKAKLYVLVTYAVESILFSYLRLNGVKAREHPVFLELTRVKQYFDKLKEAENPTPKQPGLALEKNAAGRFIRAGLSGNSKLDLERAEKLARERVHIKFSSEKKSAPAATKAAVPNGPSSPSSDDSESDSPKESVKEKSKPSKKRKAAALETEKASGEKGATSSSQQDSSKSAKKRKDKKNKSQKKSKGGKKD
ncbi:hypothetical protein VC83_02328 [Pseudogymnoascus destructans]|uniref:Exosome complex protein n=2 Tax=Pseudogymnoascus destructans TaxID=655981 RepID=L8FU17_PSED2|nr:uncharacterized protein VC83_02328 [Pseudogymnoascus destructans]ELR03206.1 hypothetical protein GMDG_01189 [Pseudogymnoascus destructans 20631-21]OAF60952.1 hypothetical protein VC83_02328 [Pseudogymnoascus destructans]